MRIAALPSGGRTRARLAALLLARCPHKCAYVISFVSWHCFTMERAHLWVRRRQQQAQRAPGRHGPSSLREASGPLALPGHPPQHVGHGAAADNAAEWPPELHSEGQTRGGAPAWPLLPSAHVRARVGAM
eukprot:scaffold400235_cov42-Prasinocladus_malaysianus.AAC.1